MDVSKFQWSPLKNQRLKMTRGVSFEEILEAKLIQVAPHPKREGQELMLFEYKGQVWVVPSISNSDGIFLKTLYPSRTYTRRYKRGGL